MGSEGWRHPAFGYIFSSQQDLKTYCKNEKIDPSAGYHEDTRPTIRQVVEKLQAEKTVWDEYLSHAFVTTKDGDKRWPDRRIAVYVVSGGSEGLYLHVDALYPDHTRELLIIGKTCDSRHEKWVECYQSAARIAWMVGA